MKIFISHSSYDKWVAKQISKILEEKGHRTFIDEKDINTGDSIDASIQTHLKDSDHLLILLSPVSIKSHWVFIEIGGAKALNKKVIPILFHVGGNEIPTAIANLLARDINDLDRYFSEIEEKSTKVKPSNRKKDISHEEIDLVSNNKIGEFSVGDKVKIVSVEYLTQEDKDVYPKWIPEMDKYSGLNTTIKGFVSANSAILEIDTDFKWSLKWLSKIESEV